MTRDLNLQVDAKYAAEVIDVGFDWTRRLATGVTITASAWTATAGLSVNAAGTFTTTSTATRLTGGTVGKTYAVVNTVTLSSGETQIEQFTIRVV